MLEDYPLDPMVEKPALDRLVAGAAKYKASWCEVDLKTDMLEEMYDILNYARMMLVRIHATDTDVNRTLVDRVLAKVVGDVTDLVIEVQRFLPNFEGPTSNEWVKAHRQEAGLE